jgi:hypothetical protein
VTLLLFGIFISTSPFLRVLAVLISARWRFVILGKSVVKLNELRKIYVSKLAETEFSNPNYRSENLKVNLEKTYGKKIMFIKMETHGKQLICLK